MTKGKNIGDETDIPAGLDVVPSVPGTFVGGHDMQGADGKTRTDRPGEILGTAADADATDANAARAKEKAKHDYVRSEVDRANREELPKLGGAVEDSWEAGDSKGSKAATLTADAASADSGIKVSPKIDRG